MATVNNQNFNYKAGIIGPILIIQMWIPTFYVNYYKLIENGIFLLILLGITADGELAAF